MANRTFLRYLPARIKPLRSPAVWAPLTVFALASIFMWEYHQNPEWFGRPQADTISPKSGLTPEEQAQLSEVDTVDSLLNNLKDSTGAPAAGAPITGATGLANGNPADAQDPASSNKLAGRENPFAAYEEQYKFPGSNSGTGTATPSPSALPAVRPTDGVANGAADSGKFDFGGSSLPTSGALSEALGRQQNSQTTTDRARQNTAESASQNASQNASRSTRAATNSSSGAARPAAQPSSNSGISAPFIRTTPDMSPPAGTTGYKAPASSSLPVFNAAPQQPSRSPYSNSGAFRQPSFNQPAARPATPPASSVPGGASDGKLYTAPSFTQPEQNRRGQ